MDILEQLEEKIIDALTTIEQINQENSELKSQLEQAHAQAEETQQEMFGLTEALRESEQLQEILEGEIEDHLKKQGELSAELEQIREDNLRISHQKHEWEVKITNLLSQLTDIDTPSIPAVAEEVSSDEVNELVAEQIEEQETAAIESSDTEEHVAEDQSIEEEAFEEQSIEAESTSETIENDSDVEIEQAVEESEVEEVISEETEIETEAVNTEETIEEAEETNTADSLFADEDLPQVADIKTAKRKKDKKQNVEAQDDAENEEAQIQAEIF